MALPGRGPNILSCVCDPCLAGPSPRFEAIKVVALIRRGGASTTIGQDGPPGAIIELGLRLDVVARRAGVNE
jgi:hypothetical protein